MGIFRGEQGAGFWKRIDELGELSKGKPKKFRKRLVTMLYEFGCCCQELENEVNRLEEETKRNAIYTEEVIKGLEKEIDHLKKTTFQGNTERTVSKEAANGGKP